MMPRHATVRDMRAKRFGLGFFGGRVLGGVALPFLLAVGASVLPAATARGEELGINAHVPADDELDALAALGVHWVRIDANWLQLEPAQGRYAWGDIDRVVDGAAARGLKVMMTLAYAPAWASEPGIDDVSSNDVPRPGTYAAFVDAAVRHYAPRGVTHFGLWNEPNLGGFFEGSIEQYLDRVLLPGADALHAACAECKALGPDLAGISRWQDYLGPVMAGAGDRLDVVTHHTYASPRTVRAQWACDDFDHALDIGADAICFYKPGLRQVLDQSGWRGEVWLTETGHRGDPWDSAGEQEKQRAAVEYITGRQLETPWWTNTFFYELTDCRPAQPDCTIDGYGLMRRTGGPDATWMDNFELKPAWRWLQGELARNPVWSEGAAMPPPPEPPPPVALSAPHRDPGQPDGSLGEWDDAGCVVLNTYEIVSQPRAGDADLSARACAAWSDTALWLSVEVVDERHSNDRPDDALWQGDSVQLAIDVNGDAAPGEGYGADDRELALARVGERSVVFAHQGALGGAAGVVVRDGQRTRYELRVPLVALAAGRALGVSFLVNDADGGGQGDDGRDGWLEWTPGIGREKRPAQFGTVTLVADEAMPDPDLGLPREGEDAGMPPLGPDAAAQDAARVDGATTDAIAITDGGDTADARVLVDDAGRRAVDAEPGRRVDAGGSSSSGGDGCVAAPGRGAGGGWIGLLLVGVFARRRRG